MNLMMVDVTSLPVVKIGDEVVLIGTQGKHYISVEDLAGSGKTINYEVVTGINPLLRRDWSSQP
jgi:alanine racemase